MKKFLNGVLFSAVTFATVVALLLNIGRSLPNSIVLFEGADVHSVCDFPFTVDTGGSINTVSQGGDASGLVDIKLLGMVPVKSIEVSRVSKSAVIPGGFAFGVKLFTSGVMVVGMSEIETQDGPINPAYLAGVRQGDIILTAGGVEVNTIEELTDVISRHAGKQLPLLLRRGDDQFDATLTPVLCSTDGLYKVGMWVRDSTAGIGTVTYYRPSDGRFGGLGHGICDVDTGDLMPLMSGTIVKADIIDVKKGVKGTPGELVGVFDESTVLGSLSGNSGTGVFGTISNTDEITLGSPMEVASGQEVKTGRAQILSCVDQNQVKAYDIQIVNVYKNSGYSTKNMVIKVTDPALLALTGGIVQGMSGSPIIQNGKLIGAVTHVLVNDPTSGFGIFIENMLDEMEREDS